MKYTRNQLLNYLIDCKGYTKEDFEDYSKQELFDLIEENGNKEECRQYEN